MLDIKISLTISFTEEPCEARIVVVPPNAAVTQGAGPTPGPMRLQLTHRSPRQAQPRSGPPLWVQPWGSARTDGPLSLPQDNLSCLPASPQAFQPGQQGQKALQGAGGGDAVGQLLGPPPPF